MQSVYKTEESMEVEIKYALPSEETLENIWNVDLARVSLQLDGNDQRPNEF